MASPKFFSFFFVLSLFIFQIHARDAHFFSKVTPSKVTAATTTAVKDENLNKQREPQPSFMQETQNAYGLYGNQESIQTQFPTTTKLAGDETYTTTATPTTTQTQTWIQESFSSDPNLNNYYNDEQFSDNEQNFVENNFQESNYKAQNNKYKYYSNNGGNVERQGMSDTRFMENGKYYYDVNNENNYFPDQYQNSRNSYYYDNSNENNFEFHNSIENSQNQNQSQEEDFQQNEP